MLKIERCKEREKVSEKFKARIYVILFDVLYPVKDMLEIPNIIDQTQSF